ncbi:hypothetical protein JAAARDRAFT_190263 [Jaapia argillacea MUCL 33604]|uniref:BTB domain-containing protein n=1 Tax=Jaapia argillacea MUCL 33604 TaxID=933084 RepID=A0A067Q373_9AGAM|nr:hypothetical protein JAAARDRAFT_190263 [Jaapia argillacea MUCL 33604]
MTPTAQAKTSRLLPYEDLFRPSEAFDIIVRSSDQVDFPVHSTILAIASPVLRDLIRIHGPNLSVVADFVELVETSRTLGSLLSYCYPGWFIPPSNPMDTWLLWEAARRYGLRDLERMLMVQVLPQFVETSPLDVFAFACFFRQEKQAKLAAQGALSHPFPKDRLRLTDSTQTASYHRLLTYHDESSQLVVDHVVKVWRLRAKRRYAFVGSEKCPCDTQGGGCPSKSWWDDFVGRASSSLRERPHRLAVAGFEFLRPSFVIAARCEVCEPIALGDLERGSESLGRWVEKSTWHIAKRTTFCP